ncbi:FtsQ-type POTRA domain-containing protein [uncultured Peptoniphilus sp.]|uniref:cell division protein FtsQ/DivIB n=1 Tax=uncultured Peptoniphilus sp. TaxID=254354 RepID=UPI0028052B68|nr:FtsQ-type POTRA domain-containing protein [uncultured Peptoniphilus sp.]
MEKKLRKIKKRPRKFRRIFRIFSRFFIFFSLIFLIVFAIRHSILFKIREINVLGNSRVKREEILRAGSLKVGEKFYNISKGERIKVIEKISYVNDCDLSFKLGGKVIVKISERKPYYQIQKNDFYLIDENFRILEALKSKSSNLLDIYGVDIDNLKIGDYIFKGEGDREKVNLLKELKDEKYNLRGNLKSVELLDSISTFVTIDGIKIHFGSYENIEYKLTTLKLILDDIKNTGKNAESILMEKGENPIVVEGGNGQRDIRYREESESSTEN